MIGFCQNQTQCYKINEKTEYATINVSWLTFEKNFTDLLLTSGSLD